MEVVHHELPGIPTISELREEALWLKVFVEKKVPILPLCSSSQARTPSRRHQEPTRLGLHQKKMNPKPTPNPIDCTYADKAIELTSMLAVISNDRVLATEPADELTAFNLPPLDPVI